ncbi:hypothetical protein B7486_60420 [cyanobacterium TDX16]|nr:hypothetical protein B7486_60420 [cyanobacterium TDX16]
MGITAKGPESDDTGGVGGGERFEGPDDEFDLDDDPEAGDDGTEGEAAAAKGDGGDDDHEPPPGEHTQVAYELDTWAGDQRTMLDGMLEKEGIPRAWEGGTLVVGAQHEEDVDELVEAAEYAFQPPLDPDAPKVVYGVGDWDDLEVDRLVDLVTEAGIPYEWDDQGDLMVLEADEERTEQIFDQLEAEQDDGASPKGSAGLEATEVLSELFVACDRLAKDAEDHEGVLSLVDASKLAGRIPLPFGFDPEVWAEIVAKANALRKLFEDDVDDDDEIRERATDLRTILREYV